jgi:streptogramin lyase
VPGELEEAAVRINPDAKPCALRQSSGVKKSFGLFPCLSLFVAGLLTSPAGGQEYMFTTLAGAGGPAAVDGPAAVARFNFPEAVALDKDSNLYVADGLNATIRKIFPDGSVTTLAGLGENFGSADGVGSQARFSLPSSLALDRGGNVYVADQYNHTIRKVTPSGVVTTVAGKAGDAGTLDGNGKDARFNFPVGIAIDAATNLYVADSLNHSIRKITPAGEVTTVAGSPEGNGTDDGLGNAARFNSPSGIAVAEGGIIYVADSGNHTIRKISADGMVRTFAGKAGQSGGADGTGTGAEFYFPTGLAIDVSGNLYVADRQNSAIRKITPEGVVTTFAGDTTQPDLSAKPFINFVDGLGRAARFAYPNGVAVGANGTIYVADSENDSIRKIAPDRTVATLAGSNRPGSNDGTGAAARFMHPTGIGIGKSGTIFVVDGVNNTIRQVTAGGVVTTLAGSPGVDGSTDGPGSAALFSGPRKLGVSSAGDLFVADTGNGTVRKLSLNTAVGANVWEVTTFAGSAGTSGSDDGTGAAARFNALYDIAIDSADNLYVADKDNQVIRKITPAGIVTTFAGLVGNPGFADGPLDSAQFNTPYGIAIDSTGSLYVADTLNNTIRKITPEGMVSTIAGQDGVAGNADGPGAMASFNFPIGVAVDGEMNVYVADYLNNVIRKIDPNGNVTTVGGYYQSDPSGDPLDGSADGAGLNARFYKPKGIAADPDGTIYVADSFNNAIRIGTTNFCPDQPTIDRTVALAGEQRQFDTAPQTATAWQWSIIRRPANSSATLSATNIRNPKFTPDVADLFLFQLKATNAAGATCVRIVSLTATPPPPSITASSLAVDNGQFGFSFQSSLGASVAIQLSNDLTNWTTIGVVTNTTGTGGFFDPFLDPQKRFYRLRQL